MSIESRSNQYGTLFGDWKIQRTLGHGSGGRSVVFELYRNNSGWDQFSALKVVSLIEERGEKASFSPLRRSEYDTAMREHKKKAEDEVRLMEKLRGKTNIVDYLDHQFVNWHDDYGFGLDLLIRMERLKDLRSEIRQGRFFGEAEIIRIGTCICQALILCHGKDILHRDIKPENIFFNEDGDYKLGDFGISRMMSSTSSMASTGVGTPEYAAPEQGSGSYDKRVDIYSLGLVLYELSNQNRLPFASSSYVRPEDVQLRQTGKPLPRPVDAGEKLSRVILKACAFRPEDRYQCAEELMEALREAEKAPSGYETVPAADPFQTVPADRIPVTGGSGRRQTKTGIFIAAALAVCILAACVGIVLSMQKPFHREEPTAPTPSTPPTPSNDVILIEGDSVSGEAPENTPEPTPEPTPTPPPTPAPVMNVAAPAAPVTPYGQAYRDYAVNGTYYAAEDVIDVIGDTYYSRKDANGKYKEGYASGRNKNNEYGYDFGFYYGDNLLYFAEVRTSFKTLVKLYYWGSQLIACRDYRGSDDELHMAGHPIFDSAAEEFSYVYALGAR